MKIAGVVAVCRFPLWQRSLGRLKELADLVFIRFDAAHGDPEILQQIEGFLGAKFGGCLLMDHWNVPDWREDCLKIVEGCQPDIVLCPDEDEVFGLGLEDELKLFWDSPKLGMMFQYDPLATNDGRVVNAGQPYPGLPHMKAYKFRAGLSYFPYHGDGKIAQYARPEFWWHAETRIQHLCCWTPAMEAAKQFRSDTPKGGAVKAVTIIGFGPSSQANIPLVGEVWSCNNCYDGMDPNGMKRTTRIFEMHKPETREKVRGRDGRPHFWHLDQLGRRGTRIIMQNPNARITNSEAFPIDQVVAWSGVDWFMGTPCYMIAMAIFEGFNQIMVWGIDQMDWEHTLQRECFGFWVGFALGENIHVGGRITLFERHKGRRYGYDWGPELDEEAMELIWHGHPISVRYKEKSQAMQGDMHQFDETQNKGWPFSK